MTSDSSAQHLGTLYGVGVGPGDPELLTLKAARILRSVPVIFTPKAEGTCSSTALEIVRAMLDTTRQQVEFASFPMGMGRPNDEVWDNAVEGATRLEALNPVFVVVSIKKERVSSPSTGED